jgi:putative oxidoreductase
MDNFARNALAPLVLRLGLAVVFVYHGMGKLGPEKEWGTNWAGPDMPAAVQAPVAWGEFIGGIALGIGFLVRVASLGLIAIMAGAIVKVHWQHGFRLFDPANPGSLGYEYNFVLIVALSALVMAGSGTLGLDHWLCPRRR